jgi:hypothetical protein
MNRITAIGLASLVAYGLLIASKYTGFVSAAREDKGAHQTSTGPVVVGPAVFRVNPEPAAHPVSLPAPLARAEQMRASPSAIEFRSARDLKAFADALNARRPSLTSDERYHLAKALEECQFTTTINEDLAAYSAKQRRQFLQGLTGNEATNAKRIAAYDTVDNTQRCMRFQGAKISQKDIEDLFQGAAMQGDARAQARLLVAELNSKVSSANRPESSSNARLETDDFSRIVRLLETNDPEAMMIVGGFLAQSAMTTQLRIGPNGETPEPSALLGGFSLVACDLSDCVQLSREPQLACAYGGYCDSASYDELYQNFMVSPWTYSQARRYRDIIYSAIETRNWALIGLVPSAAGADKRSTLTSSSDLRAK